MTYEVETRFRFDDVFQIWEELPALTTLSWKTEYWHTEILGKSYFESGQLLRISEVASQNNQPKYYLGWKGVDVGGFANIREELGEDITNGISESVILANLGVIPNTHSTLQSVVSILEKENFQRFLDFSGENQVVGDNAFGFHFKIMKCKDIKYPVLMEIEKTATHQKEAKTFEAELYLFAQKNDLLHRVVRDEPPTLLYGAKLERSS